MNIFLHLANGFEEIEALTTVDVLRRADINIKTVSVTGKLEVIGAHDITVKADMLFEDADYDNGTMIILPGGMPGTKNLGAHGGLVKKIVEYNEKGKYIAAICAAPIIFGKNGLLVGKDAVCYPGCEDDLKGAKIGTMPVVQSGKIITSRGPGTAILFSLKLVEVLKGKELADVLKEKLVVV